MTLEIGQECVLCAWREKCAKKFSIKESALRCADFSRDQSIPLEEEKRDGKGRDLKNVEDVFKKS